MISFHIEIKNNLKYLLLFKNNKMVLYIILKDSTIKKSNCLNVDSILEIGEPETTNLFACYFKSNDDGSFSFIKKAYGIIIEEFRVFNNGNFTHSKSSIHNKETKSFFKNIKRQLFEKHK